MQTQPHQHPALRHLCKRYYAPTEIPKMVDAFIPLLSQDVSALRHGIPRVVDRVFFLVLTSPAQSVLSVVPALFKIWQAFTSNLSDEIISRSSNS